MKRRDTVPAGHHLIACPGEAHSNAFIDHCMLCAPRWGQVAVLDGCKTLQEHREVFAARRAGSKMTVALMGGRTLEVADYAGAAELVVADISAAGIGSNDWADTGAGMIRTAGEKVARVSYNGRVWDLAGFEVRS